MDGAHCVDPKLCKTETGLNLIHSFVSALEMLLLWMLVFFLIPLCHRNLYIKSKQMNLYSASYIL